MVAIKKAEKFFEKMFWLLLLCSPALDLINGIWTYIRAGGRGGMLSSLSLTNLSPVTPSLVIRIVFLLVMAAYILLIKNRKAIIMFAAIAGCWLLSVGYEYYRGVSLSLSEDIQYITRFCYCLATLVVFASVMKNDGQDKDQLMAKTDRILTYSLLIQVSGVLIPYFLGMGFYTYADRLGYRGSRGFFYAGNDITSAIMLIIPIVIVCWLEQKSLKKNRFAWLQATATSAGIISLLLIGTKTSFLAAGVSVGVLGIYSLIRLIFRKEKQYIIRMLILGALVIAMFAVLTLGTTLVQKIKTYTWDGTTSTAPPQVGNPLDTIMDSIDATTNLGNKEGSSSMLFSGRTAKLQKAFSDFKNDLPLSAAVGIGRGSQKYIIEMDVFEVFIYYGILGAAAMLWLYLTQGIKVVCSLFKNFSLRNLGICSALALAVGYMFMAGHTLFSVTAGFYFAFMIVYARIFCSKDGLSSKII